MAAAHHVGVAAALAHQERYRTVRKLSATALDFIPLDRPMPVQTRAAEPGDKRSPAAGRDPCPFCQTRGDLGCAHFAPCEKVTA